MTHATEFALRLERVRKRRGYGDLKSFWRDLTKPFEGDEGFEISYDAVRTYHMVNEDTREPPSRYLGRVARVFDIRLEWLMWEEEGGEMTETEEVVARAAESLPGGGMGLPLDVHARNALLAAWDALIEARGGLPGHIMEETGNTLGRHAWARVQEAVVTPLTTLTDFVDLSSDAPFNDYAASVAFAIRRYVRAVGKSEATDG